MELFINGWEINPQFESISDTQKAAAFFVGLIRNGARLGFDRCGSVEGSYRWYEWSMGTGRTPNRPEVIVNTVFGRGVFHRLPFVTTDQKDGRIHEFEFAHLLCFAENGLDAAVSLMEEERLAEEAKIQRMRGQEERRKKDLALARLGERFPDHGMAGDQLDIVFQYADNPSLQVVAPDLAVCIDERSYYHPGGRGGVAKWSQVKVFRNGVESVREWHWRNQWSEKADRRDLIVSSIDGVSYTEHIVTVNITRHSGEKESLEFSF